MLYRKCRSCLTEKTLDDKNFRQSDGFFRWSCRICDRLYGREYHFKNRAVILAKMRERNKNNRDKIRDQRRIHYITHRYEILNRGRIWHIKNKKHISEYRKKNYIKIKARAIFNRAIQSGKITRKPCENCGDSVAHGHHEDYSRPLDVKWLCPRCHSAHHRGIVPLHFLTPTGSINAATSHRRPSPLRPL